jgi:NAD(P)H-flavin reductase
MSHVTEPAVAAARSAVVGAAADRGSGLCPLVYRVASRVRETEDVVTVGLEPVGPSASPFRAGQFHMLTAFGIGEVAISVSGTPGTEGPLEHTIRDVGAVSRALARAPVGSVVGLRGPFGTDWGVAGLEGVDVVVVAGGIGLAPLRGAIHQLARRRGSATLTVLVGARTPAQLVFSEDVELWRARGADVRITVDAAAPGWDGAVGVVTGLLPRPLREASRTVALLCGPEVMMRFAAADLVELGVDPARVRVSLERNMQCGAGVCGHCQLGPLLLCRDGPVVSYGHVVAELMGQDER